MSKILVFFIFTLWTFYPSMGEIHSGQSQIIGEIKFLSLSPKPGTAIAVKAITENRYRICMNGACILPSTQWKLLATAANGHEYQGLLIEDPQQGWFAFNYRLYAEKSGSHSPVQLRLPSSVQATLDKKDEEILIEQKYNTDLLKRVSRRLWSCRWVTPLSTFTVISDFASPRTLPSGIDYSHTGVDLRAPASIPVYAVSDGKVLSTDTQLVGGNVINIDHGQGLVSRYFHLAEFEVKKDQEVRAGQKIAMSGGTGRAEGPHLHWEMRIRGTPVDPVSTLRLMSQLCDQE